jgi:hypothetical protein
MAVTKQEIADGLSITLTEVDATVKVGKAIALLDAASISAGGTGYSLNGLAQCIAIIGLSAQVTAYLETIAAGRAKAISDNSTAQTALQTDFARIGVLEAMETPTATDLVEKAGLEAKIKRIRGECSDRTEAAETFAQNVAPIVESLQSRLRRLAQGDLTAV